MGPQPRVFHYSLDWRFLLPIADVEKVCLLLEEHEDFNQTLEQVGIRSSQQVSFADFRQSKCRDMQSFAMPFGLPVDWAGAKHEEQVEFYVSLRRLMVSGGYVLVGFNNVWNARASSQKAYHVCTPHRMVAQLKQAGFRSVRMFGAMPNLAIPEYIFELVTPSIQFALQNRFRRKQSVLRVLRILSGLIGWTQISNFLPCYFAVATA